MMTPIEKKATWYCVGGLGAVGITVTLGLTISPLFIALIPFSVLVTMIFMMARNELIDYFTREEKRRK